MNRILLLFGLFFIVASKVSGQQDSTIFYRVIDSLTKEPIEEVLISLYADGQLIRSTRTNNGGYYTMQWPKLPSDSKLFVHYRHVAYKPKIIEIYYRNPLLPQLALLVPGANVLKEVEVKSVWRVQESGDTVKYNPEAYKEPTTKTVADLFANIPGFKVLPDGRLLYQNKVVHALLLDGDNLTDEQYGFINKNLDVRAVAGIQVFNNYEKNKVLAESGESNKMAVNLTISEAFKGNISGNMKAGIALPMRGIIEAALVNLNRKSKNFLTSSANNVAIDNKADAFKVKDGLDKGGSKSLETIFTQLLQEPTFGTQNLPPTFTEDNKTLFGSFLGLTKLGKQSDLTYRFSAEQHNVHYVESNFTQFSIDSLTKWNIADTNRLQKKITQLAVSVTWRHNASSRWAGEWYIQGLYNLPNHFVRSNMSIAITDTTQLVNQRRSRLFQAGYDGAFKISGLGVYHLLLSFESTNGKVSDDLLTSRFHEVFKYLGDDNLMISQSYTQTLQQWQARLEQVKKWSKVNGRFGLSIFQQNGQWRQQLGYKEARLTNLLPFHNDTFGFARRGFNAYQYLNWKPSVKHILRANTTAGIEQIRVRQQSKQLLIFTAQADYIWRFKPRFQMTATLQAQQKPPNLEWFGPDTVLHGSQGLAAGLDTIGNLRLLAGSASFTYNNLTGNNFSLDYSYMQQQNIVGWMPVIFPNVSILQASLLPVQKTHQWNYTFRRYIAVLAGTIVHTLGYSHNTGMLNVNNRPVINQTTMQRMGLKWIVALKGKFKVETEGMVTANIFKQSAADALIKSKVWEYQWDTKVVYQPKSKIHAGLSHTALFYNNASFFAAQLFAERRISSKVNLEFTWHNVLGSRNLQYIFNTPNTNGRTSFQLVRSYLLGKVSFQL